MKVELYAFYNALRFSLRHIRYLTIFLYIYAYSTIHWRKTRLTRYGFVFLQIIDDLIDGDRPVSRDPDELVRQILTQFRKGQFGSSGLERLACAFHRELSRNISPNENPVLMADKLIENMLRDYPRRINAELVEGEVLRKHMTETFELSMDLMLIAMGSQLRSQQMPGLIQSLAWCSMRRDLKKDLQEGIINIPEEVVLASGLNRHDILIHEIVVQNEVILDHLRQELARTEAFMSDYERQKEAMRDKYGYSFVEIFAKSIYKYIHRDIHLFDNYTQQLDRTA